MVKIKDQRGEGGGDGFYRLYHVLGSNNMSCFNETKCKMYKCFVSVVEECLSVVCLAL
jgi:hypothetical protein